jgi:hypothetical protein
VVGKVRMTARKDGTEQRIDMIVFNGLEEAFVGHSEVWLTNGAKVLRSVYDGDKMVKHFMDQGMTEDEAREWISFNVEGAYVGESTPVVFWQGFPIDLDEA